MAEDVQPVQLKPETLQAFEAYIREAEAAMDKTLHGEAFLWSDGDPKRAKQVRQGKIVAQLWQGKSPVKVPIQAGRRDASLEHPRNAGAARVIHDHRLYS